MKRNKPLPSEESQVNPLEERIQERIAEIAAVADQLPAVVIIHNYQKGMSVEYMSSRGADILGTTLEELRSMGEEYYSRFFNQEDIPDHLSKLSVLLENNDDNVIVSLFQQVRASEKQPWAWYITSVKVLMRDAEGRVLLTIALASPIDPLHNVTAKVSRLLDENNFLRNNFHRYSKLSVREREILRHIALGKSAAESAEGLYISVSTVETHRRNLKRKLGTSSFFELTQYARAFDLI